MAARPLAGYRVLDLSRLLPGPLCSQVLADLGADVIKIETPTAGDYARVTPPELGFAGLFDSLNRGKRSVAINYRVPAGREVVLRLARDADVFLESSRPGQMARRGLGPIDVRLASPRIVYCSLSGYGQTGPHRDRTGHDLDHPAVGGLLGLVDGVEGPSEPPGVQVTDLAGGTLAALEILAALLARDQTGIGATLDVAVRDAVVAWLAPLGARATDHRHAAPGLGEHTRQVLATVGWSATEIARLEAAGVVAGPSSPEKAARAARLAALLARMAVRPPSPPADGTALRGGAPARPG